MAFGRAVRVMPPTPSAYGSLERFKKSVQSAPVSFIKCHLYNPITRTASPLHELQSRENLLGRKRLKGSGRRVSSRSSCSWPGPSS
jgi:hypothetical protein